MSFEASKQRILERTNLAELISDKISLKSRGGRSVGLCPFHPEKTPSFTVFDDHYFCFGCKARGDAIDWVRHHFDLGFGEALLYLAQKAGMDTIEIESQLNLRRRHKDDAQIYQVMAAAQKFFTSSWETEAAGEARAYMEKRGFDDAFCKEHGIGFAPDHAFAMVQNLRNQGISADKMYEGALANPSKKNGQPYSFFRGRLMIPIRDRFGRVIAFGGRSLDGSEPKYLNSRESELFDKSQLLFGLQKAKDAIVKKRRAIVVEGYMDVLQLWRFGFTEAVACMGTALTLPHLKTLSKYAKHVICLFDGDPSGKAAGLRIVSHALTVPTLNVQVARFEQSHEDPDQFLIEHGAEAMEKLLGQSRDLLEYAITEILADTPQLGIPGVIRKEIFPWLKQIADPMNRSYLVGQVATIAGIPREDLEQMLRAHAKPAASQAPEPEPKRHVNIRPLTRRAREALGCLYFAEPSDVEALDPNIIGAAFNREDPVWQELLSEFRAALKNGRSPSACDDVEFDGSAHDQVLHQLLDYRRNESAFITGDRGQQLAKILKTLRLDALQKTYEGLREDLARAQDSDERGRIGTAIVEVFQEIRQYS